MTNPIPTATRTLSSTFGQEWQRRDDWKEINGLILRDVKDGEKISIFYCRNQMMVERNLP